MLERLDIQLSAIREEVESRVPQALHPGEPLAPIAYDEIPLRRGILDLVSFRATDVVRERIFGAIDNPDRKIPARVKAAKLGEPAQHYMRGALLEFHKVLQPQTIEASLRRWTTDIDRATLQAIQERAVSIARSCRNG